MDVIRTVKEMQALAEARRGAGRHLVLVPTMGALHEGHLALVREGSTRGDYVVVSIFVNPTQFGPTEDFERYPRDLDADREMIEALGVEGCIFSPPIEELYPGGQGRNSTWVEVERLDEHLCGRYRPGHFKGVTTVVARLFNVCKPHVAIFGLKDAQQFLILRRMVRDLHFDVEMVGVPTVREPDGLALSSRNVYLSRREREEAVVLSRAVAEARRLIEEGEREPARIVQAMRLTLAEAPDARVQYAELVDTDVLQPITRVKPGQEVLSAVAVYFGATRLIDNSFAASPA